MLVLVVIDSMSLLKGSLVAVTSTYVLMLVLVLLDGIGNELLIAALYIYSIFGGLVLLTCYLLWGLPAHLMLKKFGKTDWRWYVILGALPGIVFVLILRPFGNDAWYYLLGQGVSLGAIGAFCSIVLWFTVVRKTCKSQPLLAERE